MYGDLYGIRDRLRRFDSDFDIEYNKGKYTVTHKGVYFMSVNLGELDERTLKHIEKQVWLNRQNLIAQEIDRHNAKLEREKEKQVEDMAYQMAKDMRKPLVDSIYY